MHAQPHPQPLPPAERTRLPVPASLPPRSTFTLTVPSTETFLPAPVQITPAPPCTNGLTFLLDVTFEDNTFALPGQSLDKQWLVENSGNCDWDSRYRLRFLGGDTLGAPADLPLYPARAGARVTLRILFTAPSTAGTYQSLWQAQSPEGILFGDPVFMQIIVAP